MNINKVAEKEPVLSDQAISILNYDLVVFLETMKDLSAQLEPQLKKILKEISPALTTVRTNLDREETLLLVERLTAITDTIVELLSYVEALNDLRKQLEPQLKKLAAEASPALTKIRANVDKEETLLLVETLTANTGTLIDLISYLEAFNDLRGQLEPQLKKLTREVSPAITALRLFADNDKTWDFANRMLTTLQAVVEADEEEVKPISPFGIFSSLKDKDVQKAIGFLFYFLKKLGQGLKPVQ